MENNITFEQSLSRLESIVKELESGDISLEESLVLFEEGVRLSGVCSELLKNAKQKVDILIESADGIKKESFSKLRLVCLALLGALIICWRTEAIYYLVAFPVCFVVLFFKETTKKTKIRFVILLLAFSMVLYIPQKVGDKLRNGNKYALTGMVLPLAPLLTACYEGEKVASEPQERKELNEILDIMDQYRDEIHYETADDYMKEVSRINNLEYRTGDLLEVHAGDQLIVPYYCTEFR